MMSQPTQAGLAPQIAQDGDPQSSAQHLPFNDPAHARLGLLAPLRIPIVTGAAISVGFLLGASHGSNMAALRYRAENAHRLPHDSNGWYQYHRSKNYRAVVGGVKEGLKMGGRVGLGVFCFAMFEETVDRARHGNKDFLSTITAGLTFSGLYSLVSRHDIYTTARVSKLGLKTSLVYGIAQDLLATLKGNPPRYIAMITGSNKGD